MVCRVDDGRCESSALVGLCAARAPRGALSCARCGERYEAGHAAVTACAMTGQFEDRQLVRARVPVAGVVGVVRREYKIGSARRCTSYLSKYSARAAPIDVCKSRVDVARCVSESVRCGKTCFPVTLVCSDL